MGLLKAQEKIAHTITGNVSGVPMMRSVGLCTMGFTMSFPCTLVADHSVSYTQVEGAHGRLILIDTAAGFDFAAEKTKNLFYDYVSTTGDLYRIW